MRVDKITYQKTYSIGPYLTDRVGFEATPDDNEPHEDVLDELMQMADEWHKKAHPNLYQEYTTSIFEKAMPVMDGVRLAQEKIDQLRNPPTIDYKKTEELERSIENAKSPDELKSIKSINPLFPARLLDFYNKRMGELTTKQ